jgi:hypothetical protein
MYLLFEGGAEEGEAIFRLLDVCWARLIQDMRTETYSPPAVGDDE